MAESKGGIGKSLQKRVVRAKEKVLQNLGKADKTTDDIFDDHVNNFAKQQVAAAKLQKELKNYLACSRTMSIASKSLYDTVVELYEDDWKDKQQIVEVKNSLDMLWTDVLQNLSNDVCTTLNNYIGQFPEVRSKISKRGRKLVDYDSTRHTVSSLSNAKKRDEVKLSKAQEELNEARRIYEQMNNDLHSELPTLYESRVMFMCTSLQSLAKTESVFHTEFAKLLSQINEAVENLASENSKGSYTVKRAAVERSESTQYTVNGATSPTISNPQFQEQSSPDRTPVINHNDTRSIPNNTSDTEDLGPMSSSSIERKTTAETMNNGTESPIHDSISSALQSRDEIKSNTTDKPDVTPSTIEVSEDTSTKDDTTFSTVLVKSDKDEDKVEESIDKGESAVPSTEEAYELVDAPTQYEDSYQEVKKPDAKSDDTSDGKSDGNKAVDSDVYEVPSSNEPITTGDMQNAPPGVLYVVEATHPYKGEDLDELTFDNGEIVYVIPFDDPEEQDEGWLMGVRKSSGQKGVFPANFTKPV